MGMATSADDAAGHGSGEDRGLDPDGLLALEAWEQEWHVLCAWPWCRQPAVVRTVSWFDPGSDVPGTLFRHEDAQSRRQDRAHWESHQEDRNRLLAGEISALPPATTGVPAGEPRPTRLTPAEAAAASRHRSQGLE